MKIVLLLYIQMNVNQYVSLMRLVKSKDKISVKMHMKNI